MEVIKIKETGMEYAIEKAFSCLKNSGIIAYPTETIYGLGALYDHKDAIDRIIRLKGRPETKGILLVAGSIHSVMEIVEDIPYQLMKLAEKFWPGPLTIVFKAKPFISELLTGGTGKIAIRIPGQSFALELVRKKGLIITSTSANPSGLPPATDSEEIKKYFPEGIDLLIDGGRIYGKPSTIVDFEEGRIKILREGAIPKEAIEQFNV
ncbi:MAG: L-threonylcarbamoyladenylate synthase [Thermodesulfovibrionales bacterium]|nr:L-threonylcarbamoyladenylate synthase [Thermodesulfovibrionales bacterium]